jgi:SAM-dependent methyltransferase
VTDFTELKRRHAAMWSNGPFEDVANTLADMHSALVDALGPKPGERWLDLGCGAGNAAELAAGAGAQVVGIDISPRLVEVAKARADAGGYDIAYAVGDAENLDAENGAFDAVVSSVGMIFAPDHAAVAREVARVIRPGGRLAFSAWTPEGRIGQMFRIGGQFQPPPPEGAGSPLQWGTEEYVHDRLGGDFELRIEHRLSRIEDESLEHAWSLFARSFGPTKTLLETLDPERKADFERAMLAFFGEAVQADGRLVDDREYLLAVGIRL